MARGVTFIATAIQLTPWQVQRNLERLERNINGSGGAAATGVEDAAGNFAASDLESILAELYTAATSAGSDVITDTPNYYTTDTVDGAFDALGVQIGGLTDVTFTFAEANVVATDDALYAALDKLDLKWGDLAATANGEGASLIGIEDSGTLITATDVEGALAEHRGLINTNTTHISSDGSSHADVATNTTHASSAGTDHSDVGLNNTHRTGDGSDHADVAANTTLVNELGVEETDDTLQAKRIAKAVWDHGAGLATASSPFTFGPTLPDNAVVTRVWYHVVTTFTSGTDAAVIGIGIVTDDADGLVTPAAISAATDWDAGNHEGIQDGTVAAFATQTTAARLFEGTIITEDTTAGKVIVYAEYVVTE